MCVVVNCKAESRSLSKNPKSRAINPKPVHSHILSRDSVITTATAVQHTQLHVTGTVACRWDRVGLVIRMETGIIIFTNPFHWMFRLLGLYWEFVSPYCIQASCCISITFTYSIYTTVPSTMKQLYYLDSHFLQRVSASIGHHQVLHFAGNSFGKVKYLMMAYWGRNML
jgi:hypothetical protein